jgi:alpha-beta hydrolase superfamily lysophospholipase
VNLEITREEAVSDVRPTPILFVHGMWHAAWCWAEHFVPYFTQHGYVSYTLSLRGHGDSEGRERLRWMSLADYVSDVSQVVGQMEGPPVLVGHSMGGMIVQKYLESNEAPAAVLLASVPPKGVIPSTLRFVSRHPLVFMKANLTMSMFPVVGTPRLAREALFSAGMPEERVRSHFSRLQDESYRAYLDMMGLNLPRPKRVRTPLLVLGAADDGLISPSEVEATARAYGTTAEFFPNMAHNMMLEDGWQTVADRILGWLDEQGL